VVEHFDKNTPVIRGLSFQEDGGVAMEYTYPARDMKASGLVVNHTIYIPVDDYEDEIDAISEAAVFLLRDALDDFSRADSIEDVLPPEDPDDEDDD
jgi:hypothetical protein